MKKVTRLVPSMPVVKPRKRVAAYARVSRESERLNHSLSAQVSYYNEKIQNNPDWIFAGVYADSGISGTGIGKREEFKRLIADCDAGRIDIVLVKSISRFARNTVDLLETVRHLKSIGVDVWFERENIRSMNGDGELMLSILASFAQEESCSISDNCKWGIRKRFEQGIPHGHFYVYGYRWEGDELLIIPEEAEVVRRIFRNFLDGKSRRKTAAELNSEGITTKWGKAWADTAVKTILTNCIYVGDLLHQKGYNPGPTGGRRKMNHGELPQYLVQDHHEPIIDRETFDFVQAEMARRRELGTLANKSLNITCFTGKIKCGKCGKSMIRNTHHNPAKNSTLGDTIVNWRCGTKRAGGKCSTRDIPDRFLRKACAEALGLDEFDEEAFSERVDHVQIPENGLLVFYFKDGTEKTVTWENTSNKDSWTPERRASFSAKIRSQRAERSKYTTCLMCKIKCGTCGENYRVETCKGVRHWRCSKNRDGISLREDVLKEVIAEVMGTDGFDDAAVDEKLDSILVEDETLIFRFKNGHQESRNWVKPKRKGHKHTEEYKERMSQLTKERWTPERRAAMSEKMKRVRKERSRNGKSRNEDTGNGQPVHSESYQQQG